MGSGITDLGSQLWLGSIFGLSRAPTGYYIALCGDEPGVNMDGVGVSVLEPGATGYRRQRVGTSGGYWAAAGDFISLRVPVAFGRATQDWGPVNHYALCSQPQGGDLYAWGEFLNPVNVESGFDMTIPPGGIVVSLSSTDNNPF